MESDHRLIRRILRRGDRAAADELVGRYYNEIFAYCYRQTGERELALDLTQEIFVALLRGLAGFDERRASFRTWMYRVASNKIIDFYRSRGGRERLREAPLPEEEIAEAGAAEDILELVLRKEAIRRAMEVLSGFDPEWVRLFQRKCFEDQTFREIAEAMELPENTVKTRYYAMIKRLREEVRDAK